MNKQSGTVYMIRPSLESTLRSILIKVAKRYCAKASRHSIGNQGEECDYHGLTERASFIDAWFEMPGLDEQYPSMGIDRKSKTLYWSVPKPRPERMSRFLAEGYYEDANVLLKDLSLPNHFLQLNTREQERSLFELAETLLKEDERLRGM